MRRWTPMVAAAIALIAVPGSATLAQGVLVDRSDIRFVSKQMGVNFEGRFRKWKANVVFLPNDLAKSRAEFDIDIGSIDLASEDSESEIRGPLWFDTAKFPVAHFASTSFRRTGPDRYDIAGKLSMKGITRDCAIPIVVKRDASGGSVAEGSFTVKRLDYRIGEGLWADTQTVADDVLVRVRMALPAAG